jgi:uncharacterized protein
MMKKILFHIFLLYIVLGAIHAQELPEPPNPPRLVNDFADMLTAYEENQLESRLVNYNDTTSTQIAIVIIRSLQGYDIFEYAQALAQKWQIGQQSKNNGLLILISKEDRKIRIHTGYGLEEYLPDIKSKHIINEILTPNFKEGKYAQGLNLALDVIFDLTKGAYTEDGSTRKKRNSGGGSSWLYILIIITIIFFVFRILGGGSGGYTYSSGGGYYGGGGFFGSSGSSRSSRGFGGFGGGSFGGGGASGNW